MLRLSVHAKIAICLLLSLLAATSAILVSANRTVASVIEDIEQQHYRIAVFDSHDAIVQLMAIGLPLNALRHIQDIIDQAKTRDPTLDSLLVYDPAGKILYSTDPGEIGSTVPGEWLLAASRSLRATWALKTNGIVVVGSSLTNDFGTVAGTLALRQTGEAMAASTPPDWQLRAGLGVCALLTAFAAILATGLALRQPARRLADMRQGLADILAGESITASLGRPVDRVGENFAGFAARIDQVRSSLSAISAELKQLDDRA